MCKKINAKAQNLPEITGRNSKITGNPVDWGRALPA